MKEREADSVVFLAGIEVPIKFRFPETAGHFKDYIINAINDDKPLYVDDRLWNELSEVEKEKIPGPWTEFYQLTGLISRFLLQHSRCVYHGVAILWHGLAWIITGPSGTGKTTQLRLWQKLYGSEMEVINGDKPIIEIRSDNTIWVHPSPWNGKENYCGSKSGRLGGIIYLEQADYNELVQMDMRSAVIPLFLQFLIYADYEDEILAAGRMEDMMLRTVPVWRLRNMGDEASAELTRSSLMQYLEDKI